MSTTNGNRKGWRRPASVPYPSIWRRFERPDKTEPGRIRKFRVQDASDKNLQDAIVKHMSEIFLEDEPTCHSLNLVNDAVSLAEAQEIWHHLFSFGCALVCLEENQDGTLVMTPGTNTPYIVGCNLTYVCSKGEKNPKVKGEALSIICEAMDYVASFTDCYAHYGVDEYLYAFGLSVDPRYRGMGIGMEILKARNDLGLKVGLKATVTTFTAIASQKLAERCGYEVLVEKTYEEIEKHNPRFKFPGIQTKSMKIMGRKLDVHLP
ncbi:uncharacterized protein LOC113368148 [Ctenocephalides felis]|uniref:uncharacterized protein LOC113368148 n=1 Tax=Ctenocephalides felis TaxID=7515 RepID=UPI000E6E57EF|nr:uncharacterized protein LOC113368148 [Ctenocephalides felis]